MKKYVEILDAIKAAENGIRAAEQKEDELINSYMKVPDIEGKIAAHKAVENEIIENSERKKDLKLTVKILKHNAKVALFYETVPVALEILAKYEGKPYGKKTSDKIYREIKKATNCGFYISSSYGSYLYSLYPVEGSGNTYNISCGTEYINGEREPLLVNNKIQKIPFEKIELYYMDKEYVEDIPQRITELKTVYKEAVEKQKELNKICDRYNSLAVGDIENIYGNEIIWEDMKI